MSVPVTCTMRVCGDDPFLDLGPDNGLWRIKPFPGVGQEAD